MSHREFIGVVYEQPHLTPPPPHSPPQGALPGTLKRQGKKACTLRHISIDSEVWVVGPGNPPTPISSASPRVDSVGGDGYKP